MNAFDGNTEYSKPACWYDRLIHYLPSYAPVAFFFWITHIIFSSRAGGFPGYADVLVPVLLFSPWFIRARIWRLLAVTATYFVIYYAAFLPILDDIIQRADWSTVPHMESRIFGGIQPVEAIQTLRTVPLNVFFCIGYSLHIMNILVPLFYLVALRKWRDADWFISAFLACGYFGFAIYLLFPVVPPRLALPDVFAVVPPWAVDTWEEAGEIFRANPYAAMPSLHCAFPFLSFLYLRWRGYAVAWLFAGMSLWLFVGTVYLGEHYVLDVIGGIIVAALGLYTTRIFLTLGNGYDAGENG